MRHGSLFSGIGGFDLAAEWMGWENVFHCEINPFCQKVLKHHFPNAESYTDITKFNGGGYFGKIDIISGGFPCQPFSSSGQRKGTADNRYLWPEMLRVISEIQPTYVVGENVLGIVNWSGGLVFEQVCADLEGLLYEIQPIVLPACGKNAPHLRDRIWFIAHSSKVSFNDAAPNEEYNTQKIQEKRPIKFNTFANSRYFDGGFSKFPTQSAICRGDDGISNWMDRIGSLGNAIVPQIAYEIFKAIEQTTPWP